MHARARFSRLGTKRSGEAHQAESHSGRLHISSWSPEGLKRHRPPMSLHDSLPSTMDSQDTLTVDACVAGLIAFGNSAIPFLVFVTSYGYPIYEALPSGHQGNDREVRERVFGEQDVPKTAIAIRDEIVSITASLLLLQRQLAASINDPSRKVSIHQEILVAALTRCVNTYSHFERRHFVARGEEKSQMIHDRRAFEGRPMENILAGLQQYSLLLNFVLIEMGR